MDPDKVKMIQPIYEMAGGYWQTVKDPLTREDLPATIDFIIQTGFSTRTDVPPDVLLEHGADGAISVVGRDELYLYWY